MLSRTALLPALLSLFAPAAVAGAAKDSIPWQKDLKAALAAGKKSDKPVMVRFYAAWCPPCRQMARDTWPDKRITLMSQNFIWVLLEFDDAREVRRRYEVNAVPYTLVISPTGRVLGRAKGNQPPFEFWHALDQALADRELEKAGVERTSRSR